MTPEMEAAIRELAYCLELLDGKPQPPDHLPIDPIPALIQYARRIVALAR